MKPTFFNTDLEIKDIVAADDLAKPWFPVYKIEHEIEPMIDYMIDHLVDHMIE